MFCGVIQIVFVLPFKQIELSAFLVDVYLFVSTTVHRYWSAVYWRVPHERSPG